MTDKIKPFINPGPVQFNVIQGADPGRLCLECNAVLIDGFGLAGGGYGSYRWCPDCGWMWKKSEPLEETNQ